MDASKNTGVSHGASGVLEAQYSAWQTLVAVAMITEPWVARGLWSRKLESLG